MTTVRIGTAYEPPENVYDGPDGTLLVALASIGEPREVDGDFGRRTVQEWTFAVDDGGEHDGQVIFDSWVTVPKADVHPKSTFYAYMVALLGREPSAREEFVIERDLIGRQAFAQIARDAKGYTRILSLVAIPARPKAKARPAPVPAPEPEEEEDEEEEPPLPEPPAAVPLRQRVAGARGSRF